MPGSAILRKSRRPGSGRRAKKNKRFRLVCRHVVDNQQEAIIGAVVGVGIEIQPAVRVAEVSIGVASDQQVSRQSVEVGNQVGDSHSVSVDSVHFLFSFSLRFYYSTGGWGCQPLFLLFFYWVNHIRFIFHDFPEFFFCVFLVFCFDFYHALILYIEFFFHFLYLSLHLLLYAYFCRLQPPILWKFLQKNFHKKCLTKFWEYASWQMPVAAANSGRLKAYKKNALLSAEHFPHLPCVAGVGHPALALFEDVSVAVATVDIPDSTPVADIEHLTVLSD